MRFVAKILINIIDPLSAEFLWYRLPDRYTQDARSILLLWAPLCETYRCFKRIFEHVRVLLPITAIFCIFSIPKHQRQLSGPKCSCPIWLPRLFPLKPELYAITGPRNGVHARNSQLRIPDDVSAISHFAVLPLDSGTSYLTFKASIAHPTHHTSDHTKEKLNGSGLKFFAKTVKAFVRTIPRQRPFLSMMLTSNART